MTFSKCINHDRRRDDCRIFRSAARSTSRSRLSAPPLDPGPFPGVVLLHHTLGWDDWYRKTTRRLGHRGYRRSAINSPSRRRGQSRWFQRQGGVSDAQVVGGLTLAANRRRPWLSNPSSFTTLKQTLSVARPNGRAVSAHFGSLESTASALIGFSLQFVKAATLVSLQEVGRNDCSALLGKGTRGYRPTGRSARGRLRSVSPLSANGSDGWIADLH